MEIDRLLANTELLCRIESVTGDTQGAERMIAALKSLAPDSAEVQLTASASPQAGPDLLLTLSGSGSGGVLLLGHYDTVPRAPGLPEWQVEGDFARGLGVCDMKGGLSVMLALFEELSRAPDSFEVVHALIVGDEEWRENPPLSHDSPWTGVSGVLGFERGRLGDPFSLIDSRFGAMVLGARVLSEALRAELPLAGPSSVRALSELSLLLEDMGGVEVHSLVTRMSADSAVNVVPAETGLECLLRFISEQSLNDFLSGLPSELSGCELRFEPDFRAPAMEPSRDTLHLLADLAIQFPDLRVRREVGAGDVSWFAPGLPVALDGLGPSGAGDHSREERALIESFSSQLELARAATGRILSAGV